MAEDLNVVPSVKYGLMSWSEIFNFSVNSLIMASITLSEVKQSMKLLAVNISSSEKISLSVSVFL